MNDYDMRQVDTAEKLIAEYEAGSTTLSRLVSALEGVIERIDFSRTPEIKQKLLREWGVLEDVFATMLDEERTSITPQFSILIQGALANIRGLFSDLRA